MFLRITKRKLKIAAIIALSVIAFFALSVWLFMQQVSFGKYPSGERLERIEHSPNYRDGKFQNQTETPMLTEDASYIGMIWEAFFSKKEKIRPIEKIPSEKTDLKGLDPDENILVWFGHSSFFMQIDGVTILVDPVLQGSVSPVPFITKAFEGADPYSPEDMPEIDLLLITHDHSDHLNYDTLTQLKPKIRRIVTGLGVGAHLEHWGFDNNIIIEKDWDEGVDLKNGMKLHVLPARHFSGRGFRGAKTLWCSFLLVSSSLKIYMSGDTGYDAHFKEIGEKFGPIDWALIENGQYDSKWKYMHLHPDEGFQAAQDLKAKRLIPIHLAKYKLANHPWDDPLIKIAEFCKGTDTELVTPIIGEQVNLKDEHIASQKWWEEIQ